MDNQPKWRLVKALKARELKTMEESNKLKKVSAHFKQKKEELIQEILDDGKKD